MAESYTLKTIRLSITLGKGQFSEGGNTKIIEGLACEVSVTKPGLPEKNSANVKVYGLKYEDMAQLTMLAFQPLELQRNLISIFAGELGGKLSLVFSGQIISAFADFNASPDVAMQFEADTGTYPQQIAEANLSVDGEATAEDIFSKFAESAGYDFINEGVTTAVKYICAAGSPITKAEKLSKDLGINLVIDDDTMIILPAGQARKGNATLLNKNTGLIGYPTFNQDGISCKCLFNPDLIYGGLIKVESVVPRATGTWRITKLTHNLAAYIPGGAWESQVEAMYQGAGGYYSSGALADLSQGGA